MSDLFNQTTDNDQDATEIPFSLEDSLGTLTNFPTSMAEDGEDEEDMAGVLKALLELHQLDTHEDTLDSYDHDRTTINRAITLNEKLQRQVNIQIALIDSKLQSNAKTTVNTNGEFFKCQNTLFSFSFIDRSKILGKCGKSIWSAFVSPQGVREQSGLF